MKEVRLSSVYDINVPISSSEHPGVLSAVLFVTFDCNLNCYCCFNKGRNKSFPRMSFSKLKIFLEKVKSLGVEWIILSGGEPTKSVLLLETINFIRSVGFRVRIDTNGTFPSVVEKLVDVVDGFAIDVKIPLFKEMVTEESLKRYSRILYSSIIPKDLILDYQERVLETLKLVSSISEVKRNSITRTVKYPFLTEKDKRSIKAVVSRYGLRHYWLDFVKVIKEDKL
jgi:pyruvate-formate lyase-activating enzyme